MRSCIAVLLSVLVLLASTPRTFAGGGGPKKRPTRNTSSKTLRDVKRGRSPGISPQVARQAAQTVQNTAKRQQIDRALQAATQIPRKSADSSLPKIDSSNTPLTHTTAQESITSLSEVTGTRPNTGSVTRTATAAPIEDTGTNLTGMQVLASYFPTWRQELGGMFSKEQLDAVEKAFADTDDWIFVRGEDGELTARNKDEWHYTARFLTILNDSGISFTDKQIKQILGTPGIKGFTFNRYFTLKKAQAYISAQGHAPRNSIRENGNRLSLNELRKRADKNNDKEAADLAAELELGKAIACALQNWPEDSPEYQTIKALYDANRNSKTPQQIIELYKQWVIDHPGTSPRHNIYENGKQLTLNELRKRADKNNDKEAADLAAELELGKAIVSALQNWPEDSPEYKEVDALHNQNRNIAEKKIPQQTIELYKQWLIDRPGTSPRTQIGENGKPLTLAELRNRAKQGDKEAADLATELELGKAIAYALQNWPKDSPEYQTIKALYDANRNSKTPQQIIELYKQWLIDRPGTSPRGAIRENGKPFTLAELRNRAKQGDKEAADLAAELELGKAIVYALQNWPKDSPEYQTIKALYDANRNSKTPQQIIELYKQWLIDHPGTSPRMQISENGKPLTLAELRNRAKQGDKEAADLAAELELGKTIAYALQNWLKDSPEYQTIKALYDANRNSKTPQQIIELYKQWLIDHPRTSPRMQIGENGKPLTLAELRNRAKQGDKEAADLAAELELGKTIAYALQNWPKDSPEYQTIKALYDANRNRAAIKPTNELYQDLVAHIKNYGHYPTRSESSLKPSIYKRLRGHQSTMVDGKYADPWLQKIYELQQWSERVKRGEITWDTYFLRGKRPRIQRAPSTQAPVAPVAKPKGNETLLKKFNALDPQQQALLEEMFDKYAEAWEDFGENWWEITNENKDLIIHDRTTDTALQSVYNTVNGTTAFSLTPAENQRMVNILQRLEESQLGNNGYYFTRLIYRGTTPTHPVAQDFHFVEESTGIRCNGPQGQTAKEIAKQTNTIRLYDDGKKFNEISLFPGVTQAQLEEVIDSLVPPGWEVRMGTHEVLSNWRRHKLHFHIEKVVDTSKENAADISITLNINFYHLAKGEYTAQTIRQLTQLLGKYLNDEGRKAFKKILL